MEICFHNHILRKDHENYIEQFSSRDGILWHMYKHQEDQVVVLIVVIDKRILLVKYILLDEMHDTFFPFTMILRIYLEQHYFKTNSCMNVLTS